MLTSARVGGAGPPVCVLPVCWCPSLTADSRLCAARWPAAARHPADTPASNTSLYIYSEEIKTTPKGTLRYISPSNFGILVFTKV